MDRFRQSFLDCMWIQWNSSREMEDVMLWAHSNIRRYWKLRARRNINHPWSKTQRCLRAEQARVNKLPPHALDGDSENDSGANPATFAAC
ncbi:hypothetical protein N7536_000170 [Penicillium majusculum]|nr:hypothetical protein N7536_000170 [Penicillium majusculum]